MELNIHAGKRVLYKNGNSGWLVGNIKRGQAEINSSGLFIPIIPRGISPEEEIHWSEINDIFLDAFEIEEGYKQYKEYFMTKDEYIEFIESEDFDRQTENAFVSDGEYGYYPISKFTKNWLEKQPFDYIIRGE